MLAIGRSVHRSKGPVRMVTVLGPQVSCREPARKLNREDQLVTPRTRSCGAADISV